MIVLVAVIAAVVIYLRPDNVSALTAEEKAIRSFETAVNPDRLTVERLYELQRLLHDDPEAKATMSAAIDTFFYRLSAEDRALLAPTVTEWKKLLEMK